MENKVEYSVMFFKAGKKSSSKSCVDDLAKAANYEAKLGFRLVSSVYDSKRKETFLFFERKVKDEED
ncbi:unnamed protein product [Fructobacillus fructosus]|uniref:Uncharacterized protein n=1 Tax=Fructobacillus fructosus TaxID=1631 RepID=A0ABN9YID7_9LACO|nr:unnamed protein product [Fructobacillus fructosus]